ncbi:MAG TPA: DedA family protein [Longimicrobium sp.]|nr:DedA family protein [Longimicrobium sp.]
MGGLLDRLVAWMTGLPEALIYLVIGTCAALENIVPPIPADVVALFGGFLAGQGAANPWAAFAVVWIGNVGTALLMYWVGRRYGTGFFRGRVGRMILQPGQMARLGGIYDRHGAKVIFISRFLPGFRAIVPIFAGTSGLSFPRAALPIGLASGLWYGGIVYLGATAGRNWDAIRSAVESSGRWLAVAAGVLVMIVGFMWWQTREGHPDRDGPLDG